uniref:Uncharacterized protein n=1 Tax=Bracon brevicornis TaxID=1563983 RepID=A0A6V7I0E5_9HYME
MIVLNVSRFADDNPTSSSNDTSIVVAPGENASRISKALGFVYNLTIGPTVSIMQFFLAPIFSLLRGILSPVLALVDYLLGSLGLPSLGDLLTQIVVGVQGYLSQAISNLSGFLGALLTPTPQHSRNKRSIVGTVMSPVTTPLGWIIDMVTLPWRTVSMIYNVVTTPLSMGYKVASYPVSGVYRIGSWPIRSVFSMLGFGGNDDDAGDGIAEARAIATDPEANPSDAEDDTMVNQVVGAVSEVAQDMLMKTATSGFHLLKQDVLPALDSTITAYQDSEIIPESIRGYMNAFHQGYSLMRTLRIL